MLLLLPLLSDRMSLRCAQAVNGVRVLAQTSCLCVSACGASHTHKYKKTLDVSWLTGLLLSHTAIPGVRCCTDTATTRRVVACMHACRCQLQPAAAQPLPERHGGGCDGC